MHSQRVVLPLAFVGDCRYTRVLRFALALSVGAHPTRLRAPRTTTAAAAAAAVAARARAHANTAAETAANATIEACAGDSNSLRAADATADMSLGVCRDGSLGGRPLSHDITRMRVCSQWR